MYRVELKEILQGKLVQPQQKFLMYRVELKVLVFALVRVVLECFRFLMYRVELKVLTAHTEARAVRTSS